VFFVLVLVETFLAGLATSKREKMLLFRNADLCSMPAQNGNLIYTFIPDKCGSNSKGYLDYEYDYSKDSDAFRVIVIGDSVAQGQGVDLDQSFPKVLQRKLNTLIAGEGRKVEVITLARSGYTTIQELTVLEREAFLYSPDLIIWSYVLNDPAHPYYDDVNPMGIYYHRPRFYTVDLVNEALVRIRERMKRRECDTEYHAFIHCAYWSDVEINVETIAHLTAEHGVPTLFLIHPVFTDSGDFASYPLASLHEHLSRLAIDNRLQVLDLAEAYLPYESAALAQRRSNGQIDPWHPNIQGNDIAANYIYEAIKHSASFRGWVGQDIVGNAR
jgi:lysophospholipase L1-like esterase